MLRTQLLLAFVLALFANAGCVTFTKGLSDTPTDQKRNSRTFGAFIEDSSIERKARINLYRASEELQNSRLVVVSFNGNVLLAGQVSSKDLKAQAGNIVNQVRHVRHVHNELTVSGSISRLARSNDAWLTSKVKSRLLVSGDTPGNRTKVVTENGVVYLMGLLSREETDAVVSQVQKVRGVQKIVKIVEYID